MADAVTTTVLVDNSREYVALFTNTSVSTGESAVTKIDVSALSPAATKVAIEKIHYSTFGMAVNILWDATTDVLAWRCLADQTGTFDFTRFGGLPNPCTAGYTGDVQFTTVGHTAGDTYAIVLECRKVGCTVI